MTLPGLRPWLFSGKAFLAAGMALYIAMWLDLPRPYWAMTTVYVVAQPFAGPTLSKASYRLCGTVLGGIGAVLLVPNLSTAPEMLTLGLALWCAVCLFLSLRDRRPHSYIFMLAGYTAAIIGFPSVDDPGAIFTTAIARVQEIGLGIICAGLVGSLVFPNAIGGAFGDRVEIWLGHASAWAQDALSPSAGPIAPRAGLAADAIEIDMLASHLSFDPASPRHARRWAEMLRSRMLLLLPLTSSIASRLQALPPDGLTAPSQGAVTALRRWLQDGAPAAAAPGLRGMIEAAAPALGQSASWPDLLRANLMVRLRDLVDLQSDCATLRRHILGAPGQPRLALPDIDGAQGAGARHVDTGLALRSALAAMVAISLGSAFWIATAWPEGSSLPVMAAVVCSFFAGADNPVPPQLGFAKWSGVAVILGGGYVFAIMPLAHEFETLILVLAPVFVIAGVIAANPKNAIIGLAIAANLPALLALQGRYSGDFASFANGGLALVGGMWCGALVTAIARVVQPHWVARRLLQASWIAVARAAEQRGRGGRAVFASLMLDRAGQLAPRLAAGQTWPDMMAAIRIGLNVVDLRRARHALPGAVTAKLDAVLDGLAAEFRFRAGAERYRSSRLHVAMLDQAIASAGALPHDAARDDMLLGLVGIRLGLFPDAPGYAPAPGLDPCVLEHAA
jgi:uncharacterized membrane protein YccC